jgi:TrpR-related protein YerC/YecD
MTESPKPVKDRRSQSPERDAAAEAALYEAVLALRDADDCRRFFRDLLTPAELQAMADRWSVVPLLDQGLPYRRINELTGVSVTTIGRIARFLTHGNGGYALALSRRPASTPERSSP